MTFPNEEITPKVGDEYVHVSGMLQCGSQIMQNTVIAQKQNYDGNPIERTNNLILDDFSQMVR